MANYRSTFSPELLKTYSTEKLGRMLEEIWFGDQIDSKAKKGIEAILDRLSKRGPLKCKPVLSRLYGELIDSNEESSQEWKLAEKARKRYEIAEDLRKDIQELYDLLYRKTC